MEIHIGLMIVSIFLCILPMDYSRRKKYVLPLCFLMVACYFAFRYDYGLDFWSYYAAFNSDRDDYFGSEVMFTKFLRAFPMFYQFIIAYSVILIGTLFIFVRKYITPQLYALFFFLFFSMNGLSFNMISALRSTTAAVIIWWGVDLFYIKHNNWPLFLSSVVLASMFHTSAIIFIVVPFILYFFDKIPWRSGFYLLVIADILSMFSTISIFTSLVESINVLGGYGGHLSNIENATVFGAIHKGIWLVPAYYILKYKQQLKDRSSKVIFSLSYLYFLMFFLGITFQERFTVYLMIFAIIIFAKIYQYMNILERRLSIGSMIIYGVYGLFLFYRMMANGLMTTYSEGNYLFYHTIFEQAYI